MNTYLYQKLTVTGLKLRPTLLFIGGITNAKFQLMKTKKNLQMPM